MDKMLIALGVGAVAGAVGALCGVGGGIIMVPAFVLLMGMDAKAAVPTSLAVIVLTSLAASGNYARSGMVEWKYVWPAAIGGVVVALVASEWMKSMRADSITKVFAVVLIVVGVRMLFVKSGA
ncbi:MAG: sulfite exporter TauE/SafE family protein [Verrucomicrobiales bacterium]|nr:sulfite exporter TauE/SafE family protein [Verrucomicrobiales bacterium]